MKFLTLAVFSALFLSQLAIANTEGETKPFETSEPIIREIR